MSRQVEYNVFVDGCWKAPQVGEEIEGLGRVLEYVGGLWFIIEGQRYMWQIATVPNAGYVFRETIFLV